ncbi:MAG TPA: AMP-binding protein [Streptosporangiaceae bacterium]|nr:AMP-binding protein [Streptosporangiaceae bacterium]
MSHGDIPIFDRAAETMPEDERAALQGDRLRGLTDRLIGAGGAQADRLKAAGVTRGSDVTLDSLPGLPFTRKQDLWDTYPFGMLAVPREDVVAVHGSSGTGGRPTLVSYTRDDLDLWSRMCARALAAAGATARSTVHNAYGYGLFTGGIGIHQGAVRLGATVVPVSGGMTARQLTLLRDLRPDILTCTPSYAIRLGEAAAEAGMTPDDIGLTAGLFGAEPWSEPMRARIEDLLGLRALDIYGLSEVIGPGVAAECVVAADGLHVNEDHFLVEAIDPATGDPVPEGTPGELVFSTLTKQAMPLLRYRSGDIAALRRGACPCGRTLVRMTKVSGRSDDMLVIRGVNVYPAEVERVLLADGRVSPHYLLVVDARTAVKDLIVAVESRTAAADAATTNAGVPAGPGGRPRASGGAPRGGTALTAPADAASTGAGGSVGPEGRPSAPGAVSSVGGTAVTPPADAASTGAGAPASPGGRPPALGAVSSVGGRAGTAPTAHAAGHGPAGALASGLEDAVRAQLGVRARVRVLAAGTVPRTEVGKAVRVITWTAGEPPLPGLADA